MIPLVIGISVLSYAIIVLAPGDPAKLLARFESYEPPRVVKWINAGTI